MLPLLLQETVLKTLPLPQEGFLGIQGTVLTLQGRDSPRQSHLLPTLQQTSPKPPEPPKSAEGDEAPCVSLNTGRNLLRGEKKQTNPEQNTASKKVSKRDRGGEAPAFGRRSGAAAGPRRSRGAGTTGGGAHPKIWVLVPLGNWLCPHPPVLSPTSTEEPPMYPGPHTWEGDRRWHRGPGAAAGVSPRGPRSAEPCPGFRRS